MSNRLALEDSPYLQQHKDNPFDWFAWCDEAFEKAQREHKAIFISIGYSSCHWCHVMEHDVFENEEIASFVNEHFVCIKVDREERPDIDKHFQEVHTLLNRRSGGWPLSIFCTPQNKPFYAATYIPPHNRDRMMGFSELTAIIADKVAQNDEKLFQNADEISTFLRPKEETSQATHLTESIITQFVMQAAHNFDEHNGGFSTSPKFPHTSTIKALLQLERLESDEKRHQIITKTLEGMGRGGMYDVIDGGFCRYSTDEEWIIPHFEKMTYDNGLLCELYALAAEQYDNLLYLKCAMESADFMMKLMMEDDLFYSASDADTEGEEGKYFTYTYHEIITALQQCGVDDPQEAARVIGATPEGNFEGHCIIAPKTLERPQWFECFAQECRTLRSTRTYPFIDRKVITAWNAMMIKSLFVLGRTTPRYHEAAIRSLKKLLDTMWIDGKLYHVVLIHKAPKIEAFLEDYAYLANTLIEAYQSTFEERYLIEAQRLVNQALERFYSNGQWYFSRGSFPTIAELDDGSYPSAMAFIVDALLSLGSLIDPKYTHFAFKSLEFVSLKLMKRPIYYPKLTEQTVRYLKGDRVIKGPKEQLRKIERSCAALHYPFVLLKPDESLDTYTLCGADSCFAATDHIHELNTLIAGSL